MFAKHAVIFSLSLTLVLVACATKDPKKMTRSEKIQMQMKNLQVDKKVIQFHNGIMPFGRFQMVGRFQKAACANEIKVEVKNQHIALKEMRLVSLKRGANSFFLEDCTLVPQTSGAQAGCAKKFMCVGRAVNLQWSKADACKLYNQNFPKHFAMVMDFLKFSDEKQFRQDFRAYAPLGVTEFQSKAFIEKRSDELADAENDAMDVESAWKLRRVQSKNKRRYNDVKRWEIQRKSLDSDCAHS